MIGIQSMLILSQQDLIYIGVNMFKPGDIIKCIDAHWNWNNNPFQLHKEYTVVDMKGLNFVCISLPGHPDDSTFGFYILRFEFVRHCKTKALERLPSWF